MREGVEVQAGETVARVRAKIEAGTETKVRIRARSKARIDLCGIGFCMQAANRRGSHVL